MDEVEVLLRLLGAYSPSGREAAATREFVRVGRELGYAARLDAAGNAIARRGHGRPHVLFLGHIDTVPGLLPVRHQSHRVYGRGAVDAKGALAVALAAGAHFSGPGTVEVVAAVGEETDSRGAHYLTRRRPPDAVIAGEPSHWDGIAVGYKGDLRVRAEFRCRRSHYSSPHPTAADTALRWVESVRALPAFAPGPSPFRSLTCKVVALQTEGDDVERATVTLDFRLPPGRSSVTLLRDLPREPGRPSLRPLVRLDPVEVDRTNAVVRALERGIRSEGGRPTLWKKGGTSDLNLVARAWSMAGAGYGPGDPHLDHSSRESVSDRELRRAVGVLESAFASLAIDLVAS
jgi:LysW-gamma-L-lysine carboxypeptidase